MKLGKKLRELRLKKNWTLADLAKESGVALSTLSRIETGRMTGTVESHIQIAKILGVRLPELYDDLETEAQPLEVRKAVTSKGGGITPLTSGSLHAKKLLPATLKIEAGKTRKEAGGAGAERFVYVIKGKLEIGLGEETVKLSAGESLHFSAVREHRLKSVGAGGTTLLSVTAPPTV